MNWNAMASYRIEWKASALKEIKHIERGTVRRILNAVMSLGDNPRPDGCRKLAGASMTYRIRVGHYRVVYTVEDDRLIVEIVRVGHRSSVYRA
jgi:mRNA interferase RelE/StbE